MGYPVHARQQHNSDFLESYHINYLCFKYTEHIKEYRNILQNSCYNYTVLWRFKLITQGLKYITHIKRDVNILQNNY